MEGFYAAEDEKGCLVVDDIFHTGRTAIAFTVNCASAYELRPQDATACLFLRPDCPIKPDFYVRDWVVFPWEKD
jgi:hypoxanthine phosphoribosyltransferase